MNKILTGQIIEKKNESKTTYCVELFKIEQVTFKELKDAINFLKYHMEAFFSIEEIEQAIIEYTSINGIRHYIIFKKDNSGEVIIYEQSQFEYMRTHPHQFKTYARRRVINERSYTFSDMIRSAINWTPMYSIYIVVVSIILFISSSLLIVLGLDGSSTSTSIGQLSKLANQILLFAVLVINVSLTLYIGIGMFRSRKKLFESSGDYQEIYWLKWYKKRLRVHVIMTLVVFTALAILINYATITVPNNRFSIILFVNIGIWGLFALTTIYTIISILIRQISLTRKYLTRKEIIRYRAWKRGQSDYELRKSNKKIFVFPMSSSIQFVRKDIEQIQKSLMEFSSEDKKRFLKAERSAFETSVANYLSHIRKKKYVSF